ncbi:MAG: adenylate/guanylate cyclase domain-containing protein [Rhodospirillales bacterium]|nr:MAG: adenylate/guanylate cyclase domain-containing protein [Rhodospirillales bacterium]
MERRLAAVLHADIVGYSRLMEGAETRTFRELKDVFEGVWKPSLARHSGRLVGTAGDAMLVEFGSAVAAVRCAVDLQAGMVARNVGIAESRRMVVRVGINLGEVIVDGDNIFGDDVNVAARLQSLADPGMVLLSGRMLEAVYGKLPFTFEDLGERQLKNIGRPVRVFRLDPATASIPPGAMPPQAPPAPPAPSAPSGQMAGYPAFPDSRGGASAGSIPTVIHGAAAQPSWQTHSPPTPWSTGTPASAPPPAPPPMPVWRLTGADRAGVPVDIVLDGAMMARPDGLVFGRLPRYCDVVIENDSVSRRHVRFRLAQGGLGVEDLGATNGTAVDGHRLEPFRPVLARPGARVQIGEIKVVLSVS